MNKPAIKIVMLIAVSIGSFLLFRHLLGPDKKPVVTGKLTSVAQLKQALPISYIASYREWASFDPVNPNLIKAISNCYAYSVASNKPLDKLMRSAIARNLYPSIPKPVIVWYLKSAPYNVNGTVPKSTLPYLNFVLFGYRKNRPMQSNRALHIAKVLLKRGANINSVDTRSGRSALHEAILMNHHEVVSFLLRHKADANLKVNAPKSKFHGMNALEFAQFMQKAAQGEDYSPIIKALTLHQLNQKATR